MPGRPATSRLRIIVLGYVVRGPLGGLAWHYLQYVMGLAALGHDVYFLEDSDDYDSCYDPTLNERTTDPTYGLGFADRAFRGVGLGECWAFHDANAGQWHGPQANRILELCRTADVCLNISGMNPLRPWLESIPVRVLIDTDPAFTQIKHLTDDEAWQPAKRHTSFFTYAENLPAGRSLVPDDGLPWQATRQPVVIEAWPVRPAPPNGKFTSVLLWESYDAREYNGQEYGLKAQSFEPYLTLPQRAGQVFELAMGSPTSPGEAFEAIGWHVIDPLEPTRDPWTYQAYIQGSKAEFGVAKHGYVVSRSGWFSERTAGYLASGRPAIVQDTGFSDWLPCGAGVLPFSTPDEVLAAIESVNTNYEQHCRAARDLVHVHFDAATVLTKLIDDAMASRGVQ
jgi:hypothetical protein